MTEEEIKFAEEKNSNTSNTNNKEFDENGYLVIRELVDPKLLYRSVPGSGIRGQINYWGKNLSEFNFCHEEMQVNGSLSTYSHPQYIKIHSEIRLILEKLIGKKLYNTYYYDRFYFSGQELTKHTDRDSCEISVSVHISSNIDEPWPIWIKTPDKGEIPGEDRSISLNPGDGLLYKGCERPHWREKLNPKKKNIFSWFNKKS